VGKHRNARELYDKLKSFEKLYLEQMAFIDDIFRGWPHGAVGGGKVREVDKRSYLRQHLQEGFGEEELVCLYEEYYGQKYRNYEALMLGSSRISLLESREDGRLGSFENPRASKRHIRYNYEVYVEHSKLKFFINQVIPQQGHEFFAFALQHLQQHNSAVWNFDTLLLWRDHLRSQHPFPAPPPGTPSQHP
jgi:hypothetical protein